MTDDARELAVLARAEAILARAELEDREVTTSERSVFAALLRTVEWLRSGDPARVALARLEADLDNGRDPREVVDELAAAIAPAHLRVPGRLARAAVGYLERIARGGAPTLYGATASGSLALAVDTGDLHSREEHLAGWGEDDRPALAHVAYLLLAVARRDAAAAACLAELLVEPHAALEPLPAAAPPPDVRSPEPPPPHLHVVTECVLTAAPPLPRARATHAA